VLRREAYAVVDRTTSRSGRVGRGRHIGSATGDLQAELDLGAVESQEDRTTGGPTSVLTGVYVYCVRQISHVSCVSCDVISSSDVFGLSLCLDKAGRADHLSGHGVLFCGDRVEGSIVEGSVLLVGQIAC
jgi:hypothetical protein